MTATPRPHRPSSPAALLSPRHWVQVAAITLLWLGAETLARRLGWPVPGSLLGLALLWLALAFNWFPQSWVEHGADGLLDHLLLFFVPAMLALVNHPEFLSLLGLKVLAAVVIGTVFVMCGTACVVELGFRFAAARRHDG